MTSRPVTPLPARAALTAELGVSTAKHVGAALYDDFLPELRGRSAMRIWEEMAYNDATVSSILYAMSTLAREVDWRVDGEDSPATEFLNQQLAGLEHPWSDFVGEALTGLPFGFAFHEIVYRMQDGVVGWERFGYRPQTSLLRWLMDEHNRALAFVQAMPRGDTATIPLNLKGIHFRMDTTTPSGLPILRGAYRSWHFKKRAEEALGIGLMRNLAGLPKGSLPLERFVSEDDVYESMKKIVTRTKVDEQMGLLVPSDTDENGNRIYDVELLSPTADPRFGQVVQVIRMYAMDIASTVLAQWVGLGRDAIGSRALAEPQQELFQTALTAVLDQLEETVNRQAVRYLFNLNPGLVADGVPLPRLRHEDVRDVDLQGIADLILRTAQGGAMWFTEEPDDPTLRQIREMAGLDVDETVGQVTQTQEA